MSEKEHARQTFQYSPKGVTEFLAEDFSKNLSQDLKKDLTKAKNLARDLAEVQNLSKALLLAEVKDQVQVQDLVKKLTTVAVLAQNVAQDLGKDLIKTKSLSNNKDLIRTLTEALDLAKELVRTLNRSLNLAKELDQTLKPAKAQDLVKVQDLIGNLVKVLAKAKILIQGKDLRQDLALAKDLLNENEFNQLQNQSQTFLLSSSHDINPTNLINEIAPYLKAISDLQHIIDEIEGRHLSEVKILSIAQGSITASVSGVAQAIELIMSVIVPWRYKHAKMMAKFAETEKQVEIEKARTEILAHRLQTRKGQQQAQLEFDERLANLEKIQLENEKLRVELQFKKFQLTLDVLKRVGFNIMLIEQGHELFQD